MTNNVKLQEIMTLVKENGHLGWIKLPNAKDFIKGSSGSYSVSPTMFMQNFVQFSEGDELIKFGKKTLNVTELENSLKRFIGIEVNIYLGGKSFRGILS